MNASLKLIFSLATFFVFPGALIGQSIDDSQEASFFDIDDGSSEDIFFDVNTDTEVDAEEESQYSLTGSVIQDFTYGVSSPSEAFSRNKIGVEKIRSELFAQFQGRPSEKSKIKLSAIMDYNWGTWRENGYTLGSFDPNFQLKDAFLDLTAENGIWIRIGKQIVARGELESAKITDIINPIDISTPGQVEFKDIRIQVPALFVSAPIGNATAELTVTNEAGADKLGTAEPGSAFDYSILNNQILSTLPAGMSVLSEEIDPSKKWEAIGSVSFKLNGGDISFTVGEINRNQTSLKTVLESVPLIMQYGFDRVHVIGLSGNVVRGSYLFKYEAAFNDGKKFQNVDPLIGWSEHQELVSGFGLEYSGLSNTILTLEINNSNIVNYSRDLLPEENEMGFVVQARWSGLNDLLSVYGAFNQLSGDDSTISTLFTEYDLTDNVKVEARIIIYDASSESDLFYTFKDQDVVKASIKYNF